MSSVLNIFRIFFFFSSRNHSQLVRTTVNGTSMFDFGFFFFLSSECNGGIRIESRVSRLECDVRKSHATHFQTARQVKTVWNVNISQTVVSPLATCHVPRKRVKISFTFFTERTISAYSIWLSFGGGRHWVEHWTCSNSWQWLISRYSMLSRSSQCPGFSTTSTLSMFAAMQWNQIDGTDWRISIDPIFGLRPLQLSVTLSTRFAYILRFVSIQVQI